LRGIRAPRAEEKYDATFADALLRCEEAENDFGIVARRDHA
jgi:hypothetical protein